MAAKVITAANVLAGASGRKKDIIFGETVTAGMDCLFSSYSAK